VAAKVGASGSADAHGRLSHAPVREPDSQLAMGMIQTPAKYVIHVFRFHVHFPDYPTMSLHLTSALHPACRQRLITFTRTHVSRDVYSAALQMSINSGLIDAPPTRNPSISASLAAVPQADQTEKKETMYERRSALHSRLGGHKKKKDEVDPD
jgi:hypothetical protein